MGWRRWGERVNITLSARVLAIVDEAAKREGETRPGFLVRTALGCVGAAGVSMSSNSEVIK